MYLGFHKHSAKDVYCNCIRPNLYSTLIGFYHVLEQYAVVHKGRSNRYVEGLFKCAPLQSEGGGVKDLADILYVQWLYKNLCHRISMNGLALIHKEGLASVVQSIG